MAYGAVARKARQRLGAAGRWVLEQQIMSSVTHTSPAEKWIWEFHRPLANAIGWGADALIGTGHGCANCALDLDNALWLTWLRLDNWIG